MRYKGIYTYICNSCNTYLFIYIYIYPYNIVCNTILIKSIFFKYIYTKLSKNCYKCYKYRKPSYRAIYSVTEYRYNCYKKCYKNCYRLKTVTKKMLQELLQYKNCYKKCNKKCYSLKSVTKK